MEKLTLIGADSINGTGKRADQHHHRATDQARMFCSGSRAMTRCVGWKAMTRSTAALGNDTLSGGGRRRHFVFDTIANHNQLQHDHGFVQPCRQRRCHSSGQCRPHQAGRRRSKCRQLLPGSPHSRPMTTSSTIRRPASWPMTLTAMAPTRLFSLRCCPTTRRLRRLPACRCPLRHRCGHSWRCRG